MGFSPGGIVQDAYEASTRKKSLKVGMFFEPGKVSANSPQFTSNPPQLHHKNTTFNTRIFAKPPAKTALPPRNKKLR
jgi:hypothetical protein